MAATTLNTYSLVFGLDLYFWICHKSRYETLTWVVRRKDAFIYLLSDESFNVNSKEMTQKELDLLTSVAKGTSIDGVKFWAIAFTVQLLSDWGVSVSMWMHGCMCSHETEKEQKKCHLKGRRAINLACGQWKVFIEELKELTLDRNALGAISKLKEFDDEQFAQFVQTCFQDCKAKMELRSRQAWTFWGGLPFSVLEMCRHYVDMTVDEGWSRKRASELVLEYDTSDSKTSLGVVSYYFFGDPTNRRHILAWAKHNKPLPTHLVHLLLGYSTSLTVMQRLEARHHLVNLAVSRGRALSVPGVISGLRRRFNGDLNQPSFKRELPELLNRFDELVPQAWESKKQLLELVYGHGLDQLHPDTTWGDQQIARMSDQAIQQAAPSKMDALITISVFLFFSNWV
jgi:hypothetical protein